MSYIYVFPDDYFEPSNETIDYFVPSNETLVIDPGTSPCPLKPLDPHSSCGRGRPAHRHLPTGNTRKTCWWGWVISTSKQTPDPFGCVSVSSDDSRRPDRAHPPVLGGGGRPGVGCSEASCANSWTSSSKPTSTSASSSWPASASTATSWLCTPVRLSSAARGCAAGCSAPRSGPSARPSASRRSSMKSSSWTMTRTGWSVWKSLTSAAPAGGGSPPMGSATFLASCCHWVSWLSATASPRWGCCAHVASRSTGPWRSSWPWWSRFLLCWMPYHITKIIDGLMRADVIPFDCAMRTAVNQALAATKQPGSAAQLHQPGPLRLRGREVQEESAAAFSRGRSGRRGATLSKFSRSTSSDLRGKRSLSLETFHIFICSGFFIPGRKELWQV